MSQADSPQKASAVSALSLWGGIATMLGLASDFLRPLGPYALYLLIGFAAATLLSFFISRVVAPARRHLGNIAKYCLVGGVIFGLVVALQYATAADDGDDRGFLASVAPSVASVQSQVLEIEPEPGPEPLVAETPEPPLPAPQPSMPSPHEDALETALASADPIERLRLARLALSSEDAAFKHMAIERLYAHGDPILRNQAVIALLAARAEGAALPIVVVDAEDNDPRQVDRLIGAAMRIRTVNVETGAVVGSMLATTLQGTVGRTNLTFQIGVRDSLVLQAEDNFVLRGVYSSAARGQARVEIVLL